MDFDSLKKQKQSQNQQKQKGAQPNQRPILYPNTGSISLMLATPKKGKYGYLVLVKPLYGTFYSGKEKKSYGVKDLPETIYLKISDEELAGVLTKGMVLIFNPNKSKKLLLYNAPDNKQSGN